MLYSYEAMTSIFPPIALAALGGICRAVLSDKQHTLSMYAKSLLLSIFLGLLLSFFLSSYELDENTSTSIIGFSGFVAIDMLSGIKKVAKAFSKNPFPAIRIFISRVFGIKISKDK